MACTGHAIAMGAFLLCAGDHRIAAHAYNIQANEVAIKMVIPYPALEIIKLRLTRVGIPTSRRAGQDFLRRDRVGRRLYRRDGDAGDGG